MKNNLLKTLVVLPLFVSFLTPIEARGETYVYDETGELTEEQLDELNQYASQVSEEYQCGVYVVYTTGLDGYSESSYAQGTYIDYNLGYGEAGEGVLLAISVDERYYDTESYGNAGLVFDYSTLEEISNDYITPSLREDEWYSAGYNFIEQCELVLEEGNYSYPERNPDGTYDQPHFNDDDTIYHGGTKGEKELTFFEKIQEYGWFYLMCGAIAGIIVALIYCLVNISKLKNTGVAYSADKYIPEGGVRLKKQQDIYLRTERHRVRVHTDDDHHGGGGGGHSYSGSSFSGGGGGHHF